MFLKTLGPNGARITVVSWKAGSRKGRNSRENYSPFGAPFGSKLSPRGSFLGPLEIQDGSRNRLLEYRSAFWAPKMLSKRGYEQNMKNQRKISRKMMGLRSKIVTNTQVFIGFREFAPFAKTEKKWRPNGSRNESKMKQNQPLWTPMVDLFRIFMDFGRCRKIAVFWCRPGSSKNHKKSSLGAPMGRKGDFDRCPGVSQQRREGPASASRARPSDWRTKNTKPNMS